MNRFIASGILALAMLMSSAWGDVAYQSTATYNSNGTTYIASWTVVTSSTTTFNWNGYLTGGGGGIQLRRGPALIVDQWLTGGQYRSGFSSGLVAGTYDVLHGFNGPPNSVYGTINTSLSW